VLTSGRTRVTAGRRHVLGSGLNCSSPLKNIRDEQGTTCTAPNWAAWPKLPDHCRPVLTT